MTGMTTLIVHIGQGKTGSTAIQRALEAGRERLLEQGVAYLGRMLEYCGTSDPRAWQTPDGAVGLLHRMDHTRAEAEIGRVLGAELARLSARGIHTAIWSNEALFARHHGAAPALAALRGEGHPVKAVAYLRRHDRWAKSAYAQWGIRHKSYSGPVMPFADWVAARPVRFAEPLGVWNGAMGADLILRNFDDVDDVVADFAALAGIAGLDPIRSYETPPPAVLIAWALYNSLRDDEVTPDRFARLLNATGLLAGPPPALPEARDLLPSDADLAAVLQASAEDIAKVNTLLAERGVAPFDSAAPANGVTPPDDWEMMQLMMAMVFSLQDQVLRLRRRLNELEEKL